MSVGEVGEVDSITVFVLFSVLILLFGGLLLASYQRNKLKEDAVKRGFAEWVVGSDGNTKWQWKEVSK